MNARIPPSRPGYDFATADLGRAGVSRAAIQRFIGRSQAPGSGSAEVNYETLLAQIALQMPKKNCRTNTYTYQIGAWFKQMILGENLDREYLFLQNVGSGDILVVQESGQRIPEDFSTTAGTQNVLTILQQRSVRVIAGGYWEPMKAPTNEISIFTLGTAAQGIVIEGQ